MSLHSTIQSVIANPTLFLLGILCILVLYILYLDRKIVAFTRGTNGASLEEIIRTCIASVKAMEEKNAAIINHASNLDTRVSHGIRNVETIRYKAFDTNGSNQSFSVALINEKGDGVILSSLHSHDRVSTFAKPIENYSSSYDLSDEEIEVLEASKKKHTALI